MKIEVGPQLLKVLMVSAGLACAALSLRAQGDERAGFFGMATGLVTWALGKRPGDVKKPKTLQDLVPRIPESDFEDEEKEKE